MKNKLIITIFCIVTFILTFTLTWRTLYLHDISLTTAVTDRVLNGQAPYKDFSTPRTPLYYYILAGWLSIFGESITAFKLFDCVVSTLAVFFFMTFIPWSNLWIAGLLSLAWSATIIESIGFQNPFAALLSLVVLWFLVRSKWFIAGIFLAILALVKQDFAIGAMLGSIIYMAVQNEQ